MVTVMIADDELDMRALVRAVLEASDIGVSVVGEAADGAEAIEVWRALDGPPLPDVIVLDHRMPGLTGLEVAQQILAERPRQLIVLYSAFLSEEVRARAVEAGISRCVSKQDLVQLPHVIDELTAA